MRAADGRSFAGNQVYCHNKKAVSVTETDGNRIEEHEKSR